VTFVVATLLPALGALAMLIPAARRHALTTLVLVATGDAALAAVAAVNGAGRVTALDGHLVSDPTSRLFLLLTTVIFFGIALYVASRVAMAPSLRADLPRFVALALLFLLGANLTMASNHLVLMWVCIEATTLAATPLIHHLRGEASYRAAWRYLLFSTVGLTFSFLGLCFLAHGIALRHGPDDVSLLLDALAGRADLGDPMWRRLGLALMVFGYGAKLGLAPMYAWLPDAYDAAPASVTAMLSGIQANCAFLAIFRILQTYHGVEADLVSFELIAMGLASMLLSALRIVGATNYKRLIAYAAMTHNGIVAVGLGIGGDAAFGVVVYMVSNALVKALLFLTCGTIKARHRTKDMSALKGLLTDMPYSGLSLMIGAFALLGFAPFGSFLGEVLIMSSIVAAGQRTIFVVFCCLVTLVLLAVGRAMFPMIWGEPARAAPGPPETLGALAPGLVFVALLFALGLSLPGPVNALFQQVAASLAGAP
jgi:hydrogenase-4 component F